MSRPSLLGLLLLLICCQGPSAQITDFLFESWKAYSEECHRNMSRLPAPTELVCNRTFDKFSCWPDALPNTTVNVSCPWFLPWYRKVKHRHVFKTCGPDGQWVTGPGGQSLRDATQCQIDAEDLAAQEKFAKTYGSFKVMYTVGYSVSLCALLLALAVLLGFSKLHCMRNYIHMNLFASFILKGASVLVIDALLKTHYSDKVDDYNVGIWLSDEAAAGCRAATVFMQYGIVANYCWLLVEGIYLHNLLVVAVFSERSYFTLYLCIGWGAPVLFLVPWVVVKFLFENIQCWSTNNNMGFWWILRFPVFLAILINFFIFIRIIQILVSKLRAHQMRYTDYKFRLAKSTLTLIPLLGIHEVVFAFVTDEHAQGTLRYVKLFFDLFLSSFQGMLVAVLYCFVNKEVQAELLKRWQRWKLGKDLAEEYKHTYSHAPSARNGAAAAGEKHQLNKGTVISPASPTGSHGNRNWKGTFSARLRSPRKQPGRQQQLQPPTEATWLPRAPVPLAGQGPPPPQPGYQIFAPCDRTGVLRFLATNELPPPTHGLGHKSPFGDHRGVAPAGVTPEARVSC
ncbi:glucagon receptor isoform X1 [Struthio camelus]|uniref:glucagon receptor isoform X1 n=1 Tax=Struthio camelus TaxID=8801 RepID=UPI003603EA12